tara:strand:- start:100 stop:1689 length:1590 start_codon:yes stop_codon:yes gene_type:complete
MEQILKIGSEQSFSERAKPTEFINSKLIDLIIPGSTGSYDLSKSYISLNMETINAANAAQPATATGEEGTLYNNEIIYSGDLGGTNPSTIVPCSALVRNADMFSANRGMVESIRRVNTLRQVLWNLENDKAEQHDGLDKFGTFQGRRGLNNRTSSLVQIIGSNTNNSNIASSRTAQKLTRDFRIPLSDLFGVGSAMWNSDVFGDTRIHLEIEPNLLGIAQCGGAEPTSAFGTTFFGKMLSYAVGAGGTGANLPVGEDLGITIDTALVTDIPYFDPQLDCPFYVGQAIQVTGTGSVSGAFDVKTVIDSIVFFGATNGTNPPAGDQKIRILTRDNLLTGGTGGEAVTDIEVVALLSNDALDEIQINRAEIVLSQMPGVDAPDSIDYRTYSTEETQGNAATSFNKQIIVEPNCQNLIIASCPSGKTQPSQSWTSYRLAIDNMDVAGNRDIHYNKSLHEDRILRFMNNRGQNVSNMTLNQIGTSETQGAQNQVRFYPILETMPLTQTEKLVNLELNSASAEDVIFYKELVKSI